ncbi:MAG: LamB/YcsF family protein [Bacteroidetes bacterium]|nr:LamB/YcsF family protein [Bacteroidota bacterium]
MLSVDINCDMGEAIGNDELIFPFISSANIACGYHAGDESTMRKTVDLCMKYGVAVGAHPSFADKENFGRTEMDLSMQKIDQLVTIQINNLIDILHEKGATLHHVKPHGALYNMAARDSLLAATIAKAVKAINPSLILFGLANSHSVNEAKKIGLKTASEVFADRTYQDDGSLTSRKLPNALIEDRDEAISQVLQMAKNKTVRSVSGKLVPITAETICIHGDGAHAAEFAKTIFQKLKLEGIDIKAV